MTASRSGHVVGFDGVIRFVAAVLLVFSLYGAATGPAAHRSGENAMVGLVHTTDSSHDSLACDDGIVCSPFLLSIVAASSVLSPRPGPGVASGEHPFLRFTSPQVDLPPPRTFV